MMLFLKTICSHCKNKQQKCNFCSSTGYIYIEASDKAVYRWLKELEENKKDFFLSALQDSVDYV